MMRIEAARRIFPRCWFNEKTTEAGRDALGYYHERKDENRNVGLGPEHDWSSHAADALAIWRSVTRSRRRAIRADLIDADRRSRREGVFGRRRPYLTISPMNNQNGFGVPGLY